MTLFYWEWHLIPRWLLRSFFTQFPEQHLKNLVSWGSPGDHSVIDRFLGDGFGVLSCQFWSTLCRVHGARLSIHTFKLLDRVVSGACCLTGRVFECDITRRRSMAVLCMLYKIRCNTMHRLKLLYLGHMCQCGLHGVLWSHISILIWFLLQNFTVPQKLSVSLWNDLVDPVLMVGDWRVSRSKGRVNAFLLAKAALSLFAFYYFPFLLFLFIS